MSADKNNKANYYLYMIIYDSGDINILVSKIWTSIIFERIFNSLEDVPSIIY